MLFAAKTNRFTSLRLTPGPVSHVKLPETALGYPQRAGNPISPNFRLSLYRMATRHATLYHTGMHYTRIHHTQEEVVALGEPCLTHTARPETPQYH